MRLILDFGNTFQKCSVFEEKEILAFKKFQDISLNEIITFTSTYPEIKSCILSSVINTPQEIIDWLKENYFFTELSSSTNIPIKNKYQSPETLGKDRLSAAVGANSLFKNNNVLSIDIGTAIKFDIVNNQGEYLGGSISPGLHLRFKALHNFTAKLPLLDYDKNHPLIGTDTKTSILSGVMNGAIEEVNGLIKHYKTKFPDLKIILTGGESIYFEKYIKSNIFADSNLVLKGLNEILIFNETKTSI